MECLIGQGRYHLRRDRTGRKAFPGAGDFKFVSADIGKIAEFERESAEVIAEFDSIMTEFNDIQTRLLEQWKGEGAENDKKEIDNMVKEIADIAIVLDTINNGVVKDIKDSYLRLDEELGEFNRNPYAEE